jgi:hypothetical protein
MFASGGLAKTQTVPAQSKLSSKNCENQLQLLQSLFRQSGWNVQEPEERKEVSL